MEARSGGRKRAWARVAATVLLVWAAALPGALTPCAAVDLRATGAWTLPIGAGDLTAGAGSDLQDSYESPSDLLRLQITGAGATRPWRVDAHRTDTVWPGEMTLWARRSGSAAGSGTASGGTDYQIIDGVDRTLFTGAGTDTWILLQLRLSGVSLRIPPGSYATTLVFTVVETP
jgi:hypothetical protein